MYYCVLRWVRTSNLTDSGATADSFRIRISNQRIAVIDAYGTFTIPGGTFDVLRKKQTEYKSTAIDVKVPPLGWIDISTIGGQALLPLGTDTITTFHFLNHVSKEAIAICTLNTAQNTVTAVQYKDLSPASTTYAPASQEPMFTYPNPVQNTLNVHFTNSATGPIFQIRLINVNGTPVFEQTLETKTAEKELSIPVAYLASGIYTLILQRNGVVVGRGRVVKI
jgi:hypothetical protein